MLPRRLQEVIQQDSFFEPNQALDQAFFRLKWKKERNQTEEYLW
jgi:hypothetical protein